MTQTGRVSLSSQIGCVLREIARRRTSYPRLIAAGKITARKAEQEIDSMESILETLRALEANRALP